jgi:hypothetical protein
VIIYQISLNGDAYDARGKDWSLLRSESGCKPDTEWLDPIHSRGLLKGEFGCSVSHLRAWERIAQSGRSGLILEEDALFDGIDPSEVSELLKSHDSVWLGYRWNSMGYWYNCHAYAITCETAKLLVEGFSEAIIPCDEWVPKKLKDHNNFFYKDEIVKQIPRSDRPSTIEGTEMLEGKKTDFRIITIATEPEKMWALEQSAEKYAASVVNLGKDHPWRDDMDGLGGMPKIHLVNEYLSTVPAEAVVMFMDGYDTFLADDPATILERFLQMDVDILFGAEKDLWPQSGGLDETDWPETGTKYKYLNSGLYIGKAAALHRFVFTSISEGNSLGDDQLFCQRRYLASKKEDLGFNVALDVEAYIFQNHDPFVSVVNGQIFNYETGCCGCIYHGNGGDEAKQRFVEMAGRFDLKKKADQVSPYYMTLDYEEVAKDILLTDFLTDRQCEYLIQKAERNGKWGELDGDKFPAQEIRLKSLGLWHEYERLWAEKLGKIAEDKWKPMAHMGLRDAFAMRYSAETQTELGFHTDASLVTGSVKLNDNFEGAELVFPNQSFDNISTPKGKCLLFPSQVTHGHFVPELKSGIKYSLTMWTSRYSGDVN